MRLFSISSLMISALALVASCSGKKEPGQQTPVNDSTKIVQAIDSLTDLQGRLKTLALGFADNSGFPFVLDSSLFNQFENYDSLPGDDALLLYSKAQKHSVNETPDYMFNHFVRIDSLKRAGGYADYVETLDIGMIKEAIARKLFRVRLHPETLLLVWGMSYYSYEACPWSRGTFIFVTIVHKGAIEESLCLALSDAGGDPPVSGSTERTANVEADGSVVIHQKEISDYDMEEPEVMVKESTFEFMITKNVFRHIRTREGKETSVKRETVGY